MSWYKTGTVTVTNASPTVTGYGTLWVDAGTLNAGDIFFAPDGKDYEVLSIQSNTGMTLATNYLGSNASGAAYAIAPIGLLPSTLAQQVKSTLTTANTALAAAVLSTSAQGLTTQQQANARANIAAPGAADIGWGRLSKSVAGGTDVTLTATEAANQFLDLTGTLTANINVIVPTAVRLFYIHNATTGAFTVTFKTAAGTGVLIPQGTYVHVYCNGTDVIDIDLAGDTHAATSKATPVDADELPLADSATSFSLKKLTWANLKTTLGSTFAALAGSASQNFAANALTVANGLAVTGSISATDNIIIAAGKGIDFSASSNTAGMTSELLDDYEEGTWNATLVGLTTPPTTPITVTGAYTKTGRVVFVTCSFTGSDTTGASGDIAITGLPFSVGSFDSHGAAGHNGFGTDAVVCTAIASGTLIRIRASNTTTYTPIVAGAGKYLMASVTYFV